MKIILLVLSSILFFSFLILYPFKVRIDFHFNIFELVGFVSIKAYLIKLFSGKIVFEENRFEVDCGKKKQKKKPLRLLKEYFVSLSKRISVRKFECFFSFGSDSDAKLVSLLCANVLSFDAILSSILLNKYKHVEIFNDIEPIYDKEELQVSSRIVVCFNFLDVFLSLFVAYKNYFKMLKENKNVKQSN